MRPALARRHHVAMSVERDDRPVAEATAHDEIGGGDHARRRWTRLFRHGVPLDRQAQLFEQLRRDVSDRRAVARRIGGGGLHELREKSRRARSPRAAMSERMRSFTTAERLMPHFHRAAGFRRQACRASAARQLSEGRKPGKRLQHPVGERRHLAPEDGPPLSTFET